MNTVSIGSVILGEGRPKICVPLVERTSASLLSRARLCPESAADLIEWRADWYDDIEQEDITADLLPQLRDVLGGFPLLFTFRTKPQGGERELAPEAYENLLTSVIASGNIDAVDVELTMPEESIRRLIALAHAHHTVIILSHHDFTQTPSQEEILSFLTRMDALGGDIAKIAVMPRSEEDVLALLSATLQARHNLSCPVITMAMGSMGLISRLSGETFGSCLTFGAIGQTSAPGQIDAGQLRTVLDVIHGAM